jgi:hypothetical protein
LGGCRPARVLSRASPADEHAFIRVAGPLTATGTAYYFIDNMATTGSTLDAARSALGFGDAITYADEGHTPR